jgi:hypothetical protein
VWYEGYAEVVYEDGTIISFELPKMTCEDNCNSTYVDTIEFKTNSGFSAQVQVNRFGVSGSITDEAGEVVEEITGDWTESLYFNGEQYWKLGESRPQLHIPVKHPLPSDVRYHESMVWLMRGQEEYAAAWKNELEERQ